uniref:Uncharacterized protein n=1 Tax=Meloidogyne hapla TaxID=6305 RepID=A0A1I8B8Q8_MELHA
MTEDISFNSDYELIQSNDRIEQEESFKEVKINRNDLLKCFVQVSNKWKEIDLKYSHCCENECINTENPIGKCIKGNGFSNIINDENIAYIECFKKNGYFGKYILKI